MFLKNFQLKKINFLNFLKKFQFFEIWNFFKIFHFFEIFNVFEAFENSKWGFGGPRRGLKVFEEHGLLLLDTLNFTLPLTMPRAAGKKDLITCKGSQLLHSRSWTTSRRWSILGWRGFRLGKEKSIWPTHPFRRQRRRGRPGTQPQGLSIGRDGH